jgi:hypothetical protein
VPNLNIAISDELLKAIRVACAETGETQAQFIARLLVEDISGDEAGRDGVHLRGGSEGGAVGKGSEGTRKPRKAVSRAHEPTGPQVESSAVGDGLRKDRSGEGKGKEAGVKRMSVEEFFKLSNSDQDRARRMGRF